MTNPLKEFGDTAIGLSHNPLGIIALFIVLVYGFAALVAGASNRLQSNDKKPIIWFMVIFPCLVLGVFGWLVSKHHNKLYGPSDFKNEIHFLESMYPGLKSVKKVAQDSNEVPDIQSNAIKKSPENHISVPSSNIKSIEDWSNARNGIYSQNRGYFISYVLEPSRETGQEYDIFIYLIRHKNNNYDDIAKTEFFFGQKWGNKLFEGSKVGNHIGIKTSAFGPFLALCKVTFSDGKSVLLNKYIDFEMGEVVKQLVKH